MGSFGIRQFIRNDEVIGQGKSVLIMGKQLDLTNKALDRLYHEFNKFEDPKTNLVSISSIFKSFGCKYMVFFSLMMQIFDINKTGFFNFEEYMVIMWCFLTSDGDDLSILSFNLFDLDRSNVMKTAEIVFLLQTIWEFHPTSKVLSSLKKLELNRNDIVTIAEFTLFIRYNPHIIHPLQMIQNKFQKQIVHNRFWNELKVRRKETFQNNQTIFEMTERFNYHYIQISMDYLAIRNEVPPKYFEQWKFIQNCKQRSRDKVIELPYEIIESFQLLEQKSE